MAYGRATIINALTQRYNSLPESQRRGISLQEFINAGLAKMEQQKSDVQTAQNYWSQNYSGKVDKDPEVAEMFMSLYGDGQYHGGGIGGVDRQLSGGTMNEYQDFTGSTGIKDSPFGNRWLGPENPLMMKDGSQINFKRDVSPHMMYKYPNEPNKWDKVEWSARTGLGYTGDNLRKITEQTQSMERSEQAEVLAEILRNLFGG